MSDIEQVCDRIVIINQGEIVFDGSIRGLYRINGHTKQIRNVFNGSWTVEQLEKLGHLREIKGDEVLLEVEPDQAPAVVSHLFGNFPVQDISITAPPHWRMLSNLSMRDSLFSLPIDIPKRSRLIPNMCSLNCRTYGITASNLSNSLRLSLHPIYTFTIGRVPPLSY